MKKSRPIGFWPPHHEFRGLVQFSIRGATNPNLLTNWTEDHIAELSDLLAYDTDPYFWFDKRGKEMPAYRRIWDPLKDRVMQKDLRAAELVYAIATDAAFEVLNIYLRRPDLFAQIAPKRNLLPVLISIHPKTAKVVEQMRLDVQLGAST